MYDNCKIHGPYFCKSSNRQAMQIEYPNGYRYSINYSRYLIECHLGRYLNFNEHVHHKDENTTNDNLDNLEVLSSAEHRKLHQLVYEDMVTVICSSCKQEFAHTRIQQIERARRVNSGRAKSGPFCSKDCQSVGDTI